MHSNGHALVEPQTVEATVAEIERSRQRLSESLGALRQELNSLADWQEWIRRKPWHFVGGAFLIGCWLGWRKK